ncbi:MAG: MarR family transcriptional regulator, partial [Gemmatimonadota bacterium]
MPDIARALDIARPAALKLVNQLVDLGLVETHPIPSDKR